MFSRIFISSFLLCILSLSIPVSAKSSDNPFAKSESLDIGKNISWKVDKDAGLSTKSIAGDNGVYYHLRFNNKRLELLVSSDAGGLKPKQFNQLNIKNVEIDGKQSSLFKWCLNNQESHNRFLQQGLAVKNDICVADGKMGSFMMRLNKETLTALKKGKKMSIMLKPFRTPLELHYDLSDFEDMYVELNTKAAPVVKTAAPTKAVTASSVTVAVKKICTANPPGKYKIIKSVEYDCADASAKQVAERKIDNLVKHQEEIDEKQRKLAEEKRQQKQAAKLKQEEQLRLEAAAVAASEAKQAEISGEIAQKMLKVCEKYWSKGEHRCYCQKYIEHAPSEIQANSTCQ